MESDASSGMAKRCSGVISCWFLYGDEDLIRGGAYTSSFTSSDSASREDVLPRRAKKLTISCKEHANVDQTISGQREGIHVGSSKPLAYGVQDNWSVPPTTFGDGKSL
ncbi:hypothetical protein CYMTET_19415 [Cymbomonas tetramitiformis]|uniref:Uncharacterized protein n=1 Tax=Cymbomonas tetramitiformis TaxID=36881 RepID=A0AAE0L4W8_9CHLO|nr:hypothetical protein CYMTET_19415 [Cymbomonas tetramitiformis]